MEEHWSVCAFSGHRRLSAAERGGLVGVLDRAIEYLYEHGVRTFICGGALGFDTVATGRVMIAKWRHEDIRLKLVLPCADQADRWSIDDQRNYRRFLASADEVECLQPRYTDGCMRARNARMVELADVLVCYALTMRSGTGQTIRLMEKKGGKIFNLAPQIRRLLEQIEASRRAESESPPDGD